MTAIAKRKSEGLREGEFGCESRKVRGPATALYLMCVSLSSSILAASPSLLSQKTLDPPRSPSAPVLTQPRAILQLLVAEQLFASPTERSITPSSSSEPAFSSEHSVRPFERSSWRGVLEERASRRGRSRVEVVEVY